MANPQQEPTMEEILASIRKIISEDSAPSAASDSAGGEADVLNLTQEVQEQMPACTSSAVTSAPTNSGHHEPAEIASAPSHSEDGFFSEKARAATEHTMSSIAEDERDEPENRAASTAASVEEAFQQAIREAFEPLLEGWLAENRDTVVERMKPVIRDWLDEHFASMLENAVKNELARAARSRTRH